MTAALCFLLVSTHAATFTENFASDPLTRGWRASGDTNLFHWNSANQNLGVTWDSSRPNSFFCLPVGTILNRNDDFSVAFDLELADVAAGVDPNKPSTFELAIGFLNLVDATKASFFRGNSAYSPNLVEFDFFPDTGFGATIWPSLWSTNSSLNYNGSTDYTILDLSIGVLMRVTISYTAGNRTLATSITTNGTSIGSIHNVMLSSSFTDFRVGAFAVESYSDAGQDPQYGGSLLAHGTVDNIAITVPPPPVQQLAGKFISNQWQITFVSRTNWLYTLERSPDFQSWLEASASANGNGTNMNLLDATPMPGAAFYRVRAERP